jgi:L-ascorbate metabolism protein UlaG (beta-lactamase superfamily)
MQITWLGHSGFRIALADAVLLIDPWLTGNPLFPATRRHEAVEGVTHVFLTHAHGDHLGDAIAIARETGAPIAGIYDFVAALEAEHGVATVGFNKGGTVRAGSAAVTMVNASHSSSHEGKAVGSEAGFMIAAEGHVVYVSGDTDIMADMDWMGDYHKPDIGILCAGGFYTMDMARAAYAARRYFDFELVIPCHYRTFPALAQDATELRAGLPGVTVVEPEVLVPITVAAR